MTIVLKWFVLVAVGTASSLTAQPSQLPPTAESLARVTSPSSPPTKYAAVRSIERIPKSPWIRYFTTDSLGRTITFYVSEEPADGPLLPVVVFVQGSGSQSIFSPVQTPTGVRVGASGGQGSVGQAAKGKALVVIAEKPGVGFLDRPKTPGSAEEGSKQFREEHTLDRWCEAVNAAMQASMTLPRADRTRVMVEGHSEGGLVACKVAADHPEVTHVAILAGGGPTQLFDLVALAKSGALCGGQLPPPECEKQVWDQWNEVLKDPMSPDKFFMGHPNRRWTTFLATSPAEELKKTRAHVFIGQGTADKAVAPVGADMLYATLKALGRDVTYAKVDGGDHGFMTLKADGSPDPAGWQAMHDRVVAWFLEPSTAGLPSTAILKDAR